MKYAPKTEVLVFQATKELGEGSREEIREYLKDHLKLELEEDELLRYLFRWKAKKVFTIRTRNSLEVWALADIPPWYTSGIMATLAKSTNEEMKIELDALDARIKDGSEIITKHPQWNTYKSYLLTFEAVDRILGGRPTKKERELQFPKREDNSLFVPSSWFYGWMRDNQGLMECVATQYHTAWGNGEFPEQPETSLQNLHVKTGMTDFEAIPEGTQFKVILRFPMKGSKMKSDEDLFRFFDMLAEAPIRGFGAYPRAFGGRIRIVEKQDYS